MGEQHSVDNGRSCGGVLLRMVMIIHLMPLVIQMVMIIRDDNGDGGNNDGFNLPSCGISQTETLNPFKNKNNLF